MAKDIYTDAHIMAKKLCEKYGDIDYRTQFQLCLSYFSNSEINTRVNEIMSQVKVSEDEARLLEKAEYYFQSEFEAADTLTFRLWQRKEKKRVYITAPYIKEKTYVDLVSEEIYDKKLLKTL